MFFMDASNSAAAASISLSLKPQLSNDGSVLFCSFSFTSSTGFCVVSFAALFEEDFGKVSKSSSAPATKLVR